MKDYLKHLELIFLENPQFYQDNSQMPFVYNSKQFHNPFP